LKIVDYYALTGEC